MKKYIFPILISVFLFHPSQGFSEVKEIISEGTYNMGDGETPSVAESRALLQAKRVALEQAGTYVESYSKVINFQLTEDEIQVLASGLMEVEILDKKRTVVGDGFHFYVKIKAKVNLDKTEELANRIKAKDKSFVEDYKKIQEAYDKSQKEIEELKKELSQAKGEKEKRQVEAKITGEEKLFQANEWFEKGYQIYSKGVYDERAIEAFTSALALNPNIAEAYLYRGNIYGIKGLHDRAIEDYNNVVIIDPNNTSAYFNRGSTYLFYKVDYDNAIRDYNKIIEIAPDSSIAYSNRAETYKRKKVYDKALDDYNRAIEIYAYPGVYNGRGELYFEIGQYDKAIEDFNKAITMEPDAFSGVYLNRGFVYQTKGSRGKAISDFQKACDMGNENGCENLQKALKDR